MCMSALMMGVLPFTCFTFTFSEFLFPKVVFVCMSALMMGVLPFTHSKISLFHKKIVQVVFVCMSALMIGVLPFTHSTISLSLVHKKFPDGVYLYVCPDDGGVTINQFHFHCF